MGEILRKLVGKPTSLNFFTSKKLQHKILIAETIDFELKMGVKKINLLLTLAVRQEVATRPYLYTNFGVVKGDYKMNKEQLTVSRMARHNNEIWDELYEMKEKIERDNEDFICVTCLEIKEKIDNLMNKILEFNIKMLEKAIKANEEQRQKEIQK